MRATTAIQAKSPSICTAARGLSKHAYYRADMTLLVMFIAAFGITTNVFKDMCQALSHVVCLWTTVCSQTRHPPTHLARMITARRTPHLTHVMRLQCAAACCGLSARMDSPDADARLRAYRPLSTFVSTSLKRLSQPLLR
jgi:hypothetical protein